MVYKDRLETNSLQLFAHPQYSEWFSITSAIIFEVNVGKHNWQRFLFFTSFRCPQLFDCQLPYRCSGVPAAADPRPHTGNSGIGKRFKALYRL